MVSVVNKPPSIQHRSQWDIMASILSAATAKRTKTYIMRKCNLSYRQLQAYLNILCERDLLKAEFHQGKSNPGKIFVTTDRGHTFLKAYNNLKNAMEEDTSKFHLTKVRP